MNDDVRKTKPVLRVWNYFPQKCSIVLFFGLPEEQTGKNPQQHAALFLNKTQYDLISTYRNICVLRIKMNIPAQKNSKRVTTE